MLPAADEERDAFYRELAEHLVAEMRARRFLPWHPEKPDKLSATGERIFMITERDLAALFDHDAIVEKLVSRALGQLAYTLKKRTGLDVSEALLRAWAKNSV